MTEDAARVARGFGRDRERAEVVVLAILFVFAVVTFAWLGYDQTYSNRAYAHRQSEVQNACLKAHPVSRASTAEAFAAAGACFELPAPPPGRGELARVAGGAVWPALMLSVWLRRWRAIRRRGGKAQA